MTLPLTPLGFGAAPIGNLFREVSAADASAAVEAAWTAGVRYFDTAPHYGLGLSEARLGEVLRGKPRNEFVLSTKVGRELVPNQAPIGSDLANGWAVPDGLSRLAAFDGAGIRRTLEGSLERLGLDYVDLIYIHDPDEYDLGPALEQALPAVAKLRSEGLVRAVGIGSKSIEALSRAVREGELDVIMIAGRYTLLEQPAAAELLPLCAERGVRAVAAAPFNSGLLATSPPRSTATYEYDRVPDAVLDRAKRIDAVCAAHGVELPAAALQFPLRHPVVESVVVGARSAAQVAEIAARAAAPIPEALWRDLAEAGLA